MNKIIIVFLINVLSINLFGQKFEESVTEVKDKDGPQVSINADFALQYQGLKHKADSLLIPLGSGINLPTANFALNALLADGISVNLSTYLSSRHHVEAWVKDGYLLLDKLPFIKSQAIDKAMEYLSFKVGVMELNYGDAHFRRSDNGNVINNKFVGNYIVDAFTTAPAFEALFRHNGILIMGAVSGGTLKPSLVEYNAGSQTYTAYNMQDELAFYWKAGYDKEINSDFRIRTTLSGYHAANHHFGSLYNGDRTGSRYYLIMNRVTYNPDDVDPSINHMSGQWGPGFTDKDNSIMANLFTRYKFFELFGTYELISGTSAFGGADFRFNQYALETILYFGKSDQFFGAARYNHAANDKNSSIGRLQLAAAYSLTPNIILKLEYVNQNYDNFQIYGENAGFNGLMMEAAISF